MVTPAPITSGSLPRWPARSSSIPGAFQVNRKLFNELDDHIRSLQTGSRQHDDAMDLLTRLLAMTHKGFAQAKSRGAVSPSGSAGRPWVIPVRRITQDYYRGWIVRRIGRGAYLVTNLSREAVFIEFGINPRVPEDAVRRPIMKMSAVATLRFVQRTQISQRFAQGTFGSLRSNKGQFRSFAARMAGSSVLGVVGPQGRLP